MAGGGGGGNTTSRNVTETSTSNLPAYARPHYERSIEKATELAQVPYQQYPGQRIADFDPATQRSFDIVTAEGLRGTPEAGTAAAIAANMAREYLPIQTIGDYEPGSISTGRWTHGDQQAYMNPFQTQVMDVEEARARKRFQEGQGIRQAEATQAGAFGGSRRHVTERLAERDLEEALALSESQGLRDAFTSAQQMYTSDEARALQAAGLDEDARRTALVASEEARQGAAGLRLQAAEGVARFGALGADQRAAQAQALSQIGAQKQEQQQLQYDQAFDDFVNQRDFPRQQLAFFNQVLHGQPVTPQQEVRTTTSEPSPSVFSQLGGAGLGAVGLSQLLA